MSSLKKWNDAESIKYVVLEQTYYLLYDLLIKKKYFMF